LPCTTSSQETERVYSYTGGLRETHPTVSTAPPMSLPNPNSNLDTNPNPKTKTNPNPIFLN